MFLLAASLFLLVSCLAQASDVLVFDSNSFDTEVKKHDLILVEFYAPWCGHCKALAPKYDEAATLLKENDPPLSIAKVDCDAEKDLCQRFGVGGYPTLKFFRNGEVSEEYNGPRDSGRSIANYVIKQASPSSTELKSESDEAKFLGKDEYTVLGCFAKETGLYTMFQDIANAERNNYRFAHTTESSLVKKHKCENDIIVFQPKKLASKFEEPQVKYKGAEDKKSIKEFIKTTCLGLCGIREHDNIERFPKPLVIAYFDVDYEKNPKGTNYWRNRVLKVAEQFKNKMTFSISSKGTFSHELESYGMSDKKSEKPLVAALNAKGQKFVMTEEFSIDNLKKFADDVLAEKLEPYMKSESIPEKNDEPVKVVVGKTFDSLVNDPTKDVLIEFYAPWCGHCKQLAPKYDELATKLKDEPNVLIAKMDATANDVPPTYNVQGFPTIYWVPKGNKANPQQYEGGREVKDFIKFIAKQSTEELKGFTRDGKKSKKDKSKSEL